jgi:r1t holin
MSVLSSKLFWYDALERSVKTVAQTLVAMLTASGVFNLFSVNWGDTLSVAGLAGLISILTSVGSAGSGNSASLVVDLKKK